MTLIRYPSAHQSGLAPESLDRIVQLPLIQLITCGRSGSMLLHSLLDGHPEIIHIPHTFKFFDFAGDTQNISVMTGFEIANAFVSYPAHLPIFDSQESVLLRGRLGIDMGDRVIVDRTEFCDAMAKILPNNGYSMRKIFCAAILTYAWCLGQPIDLAKVILMHLHHGDWLWPKALVEKCNIASATPPEDLNIFRPDKLIVTVRNPVDQISTYERFVTLAVKGAAAQRVWFERYLRLLIQDWKRIELVGASKIPLRIVRLEDLRTNPKSELSKLANWIGVANSLSMSEPTIFGLPWWGDTYSTPSRTPKFPEPIGIPQVINSDHCFMYSAIGSIAVRMGYPPLRRNIMSKIINIFKSPITPMRPWFIPVTEWREDLLSRKFFLNQLYKKHKASLCHERKNANKDHELDA